jgi:hypothetical protein
MSLSPKVLLPVVLGVIAAAALALITGDESYLVALLIPLAGGAAGYIAPPVGGVEVTQEQIERWANKPRR